MIKRLNLFLYLIIGIALVIIFYEFKNYMSIKEGLIPKKKKKKKILKKILKKKKKKKKKQKRIRKRADKEAAEQAVEDKNEQDRLIPTESNIDTNLKSILIDNNLSNLLELNEDQIEIDCNSPYDMINNRGEDNRITNRKMFKEKDIDLNDTSRILSRDDIIVLSNKSIKRCSEVGYKPIESTWNNHTYVKDYEQLLLAEEEAASVR
jgi:hypothetical protein